MERISSDEIACLLFDPQKSSSLDLRSLAEAALQWTPQVAIRTKEDLSEAIFLNLKGTERLFSKEKLQKGLGSLVKVFSSGFLNLAFGSDAGSALACARYRLKRNLPLPALRDYVSPFSFDPELDQFVVSMVSVLDQLGLRTLEDFLSLPSHGLASRFGKQGIQLRAIVSGQRKVPWPRFQVSEVIEEKMEVDGVYELEAILFVLKNLLDRVTSRTRGQNRKISILELEFSIRSSVKLQTIQKKWQFDFPVPQVLSLGIVAIIRNQLNFEFQKNPLPGAVHLLKIKVIQTVPGLSSQYHLFHQEEQEKEQWNSFVGRLIHQLGQSNVFMARAIPSYIPEKAWTKNSLCHSDSYLFKAVPSWVIWSQRPARILKRPVLLKKIDSYLILSTDKRWKIVSIRGPEKISLEWWKCAEVDVPQREYYQVFTEQREGLWIYQQGEQIYLHGYFD